jgi:hypothetical protein
MKRSADLAIGLRHGGRTVAIVGERLPITLLERIVMWNVYVAVLALIAYWIAVPQSPFPH